MFLKFNFNFLKWHLIELQLNQNYMSKVSSINLSSESCEMIKLSL